MAKKESKEVEEGKAWAFIAYLLGIVGFVIAVIAKKDNKYVMYHAAQSLVIVIAYAAVAILGLIPVIGWFVIWPIGFLLVFVLWIIGMVNGITGKLKPVPVIGKFGEKIKL